MSVIEQKAEIVAKENLVSCRFSPYDVLTSADQRAARRWSAERATVLGNGYQGKVDIYFKTADGTMKRVQTTVWAADNDFLTLKSGTSLPLRSVVGFDFY
jgi:hypothetical protein